VILKAWRPGALFWSENRRVEKDSEQRIGPELRLRFVAMSFSIPAFMNAMYLAGLIADESEDDQRPT